MATQRKASPKKKGPSRRASRGPSWGVWLVFLVIAGLAAVAAGFWVIGAGGRREAAAAGHRVAAVPSPVSGSGAGPSPVPSPVPITPPPCVAPPDWTIHIVEEGDTLYSLAERFRTDVETLMVVNCLEDEVILIAQELSVPGPAARRAASLASRADIPDRFTHIILLGSDKREEAGTWRTDTMIVLSVDSESDFVRLLSLPRDLWVDIPGHGEDRINTAEMWGELEQEGGGPDLVKETIYDSLGIPIRYYVRVDFAGFTQIIDALGGVEIEVECPLPDIEVEPGRQHMDGEEALLYARSRISTDDFDRNRRQRKLLMALWEQGLTVEVIPKLPALWKAMAGTFETDLPLDEVVNLALKGLRVRPNTILSESIGPGEVESWISPGGADVLLPLDDEIQELLEAFYAPPDLASLERAEGMRVEVWNGTPRHEALDLAIGALHWEGFRVASTGSADRLDYATTQILVYGADVESAEAAAQSLGVDPNAILYLPDSPSPVEMQIILGADYDPCAHR